MFIKLATLGKVVSKGNANPFYQDIGPTYTIGIRIRFNQDGTGFMGCNIEDFGGGKFVPYKKGPSMGCDPLPVTKMSGKTENVFKRIKKYLKFLDNYAQKDSNPGQQALIAQNLLQTWDTYEDDIKQEMHQAYEDSNATQKKRAFFFISLDDKPLWELDLVQRAFTDDASKRFQHKDNISTTAKDQLCAICGKKQAEVFGNVSLIPAYNLDQPGFIPGGANAIHATKNLPVCLNCAGLLSKGFDYATNHLRFPKAEGVEKDSIKNLQYFLIPSVDPKTDIDFVRGVGTVFWSVN